jgi:hypothetical protein
MDVSHIKSFALERNLHPTEALQAKFQYITVTVPFLPRTFGLNLTLLIFTKALLKRTHGLFGD